jgi:hypothetical protein
MAAPEVTGRKIEAGNPIAVVGKKKNREIKRVRRPLPPRQPGDDYTIPEFCRKRRITESFYHKIQSLGLGPKVRRTGGRVTITTQADEAWQPPGPDELAAAAKTVGMK